MSKTIFIPPRGSINPRAAAYYQAAVERELTTREVRLLPYIQYVVMNGGAIDARRVNAEEVAILEGLHAAGWVIFKRGDNGYQLAVTESYWQHMNYVLFITYAVQVVDDVECGGCDRCQQ
ncbi:hypothetical protein HWC07_gp070 [Pantoea phage vB_PagM_LIET2]|uniref:Uncharacterized protein n=1 Tax=Pantoea phage vB_PagM_LIET2 TaxID=2508071 RepID=A0A411AW39_9CAUD|nr:hypothetical protein HWC07_gp070 [Pantoea phage vB_PagM_LIET2]QAX92322.1 hypothetical protein LIET2_gp070 [Pantoea phage vB_PagM_LIET2]